MRKTGGSAAEADAVSRQAVEETSKESSLIKLITRGDDAGSNVTANRAIRDACVEGVLRNVSVMVPCDAVEDAAGRLSDLEHVCIGFHATLNAEWSRVRWGSVADPARVPSLVMGDGTFFPSVAALETNGAALDQAMIEMQAQLDRGREIGFDFRYADRHMNFGRAIPAFEDAFDRWCETEGIQSHRPYHRRLVRSDDSEGDPVEQLIQDLDRAEDGQWALVGHPGYETDEMRQIGNERTDGAEEATNRDWQRRWFMDPRIISYFEGNDIEAIRYDEAEKID